MKKNCNARHDIHVSLGKYLVWTEITLKGKVTDAKSGKALIGANVRLIGTSIGIATNNKGSSF